MWIFTVKLTGDKYAAITEIAVRPTG